jgi:hypothetical protein
LKELNRLFDLFSIIYLYLCTVFFHFGIVVGNGGRLPLTIWRDKLKEKKNIMGSKTIKKKKKKKKKKKIMCKILIFFFLFEKNLGLGQGQAPEWIRHWLGSSPLFRF